MNAAHLPLIVLPGARGHAPDCALFRASPSEWEHIIALRYPTWQTYVDADFSAEKLVDILTMEIAERVPQAPIVLLGVSIGGHFAYATALRLESLGRTVAGLCIIDSGAITAARSAHWNKRLVAHAVDLLRRGRPGALAIYARQLLWRGLFRLAGKGLPALARDYAAPLHLIDRVDPAFAEELSMRLLIRITDPWVKSLDDHSVRLRAPAALLRTGATASSDVIWRGRCPELRIIDLPGNHETLFEAENAAALHRAFLTATVAWNETGQAPDEGVRVSHGCEL